MNLQRENMIQCGIVGWKNSGKTFFAQKLIEYFSKKNLIVASIKHAHHNFDIDKPDTDSYLHRQAGSQQVIISSSKRWAKIVELKDKSEKKLNELLQELDAPDIVIIEGFKDASHPKIEIIRKDSDNYLFPKIKNVLGLVSDSKIDTNLPQFKRKDIGKIAEFILTTAK